MRVGRGRWRSTGARRSGFLRPFAALMVLGSALAVAPYAAAEGVPVGQATDEQKAAAQELFLRAQDKSKAGDHDGALVDLRGSFDVVASPNTRLLIARELVVLGRLAEAYREAVAAEALAKEAAAVDSKYEDTAKAAADEKASLATKVGFVRVDMAGKSGELVVGGKPVAAAEKDGLIPVDPGTVEVVIRSAQGTDDAKTVQVTAGAETAVSFRIEVKTPVAPPETKSGAHPFDMGEGQRITGIVLAGVGVVGFAMFAGFGAANQSIFSDLEEQCAGGSCPASLEEDADQGRKFQTAANVTVTIGAIGLAAGAALLIPTFIVGDDSSNASRVNLRAGLGHLAVEGSF
jgi:hypothetical protein